MVSSGCTTAIKSDKIIAIKQRTFGIHLGADVNQTPTIKLGLVTTIYQMVPTSTNQIYAPRYFDVFRIDQTSNPFKFGIDENSGFGDVSILTNAQGKAILPAPGAPTK